MLLFHIGSIHDEQGDIEKALECYQKAIFYDSYHIDSYNNMGNLLRRVKRLDEASVIFLRALVISPNLPQLYNNLGNVYLDAVLN